MILLQLYSTQAAAIDIPKIAVDNCKRVSKNRSAEALVIARKMYQVEREFNIPENFQGMSLAAACLESGFNPRAKGDKSKKGRYRALGVLQLWPWWEKYYKVDRTDPEASTRAWMAHIMRQLPKVKKSCRPRSKSKQMVQAWVHAIRAPKKTGRCRERPLHLKQLKKIRKVIRKTSAGS